MGGAAEQGDEADEAFGGTNPRAASGARPEVPPNARAVSVGRGHRFAAYPRCSADLSSAILSRSYATGEPQVRLARRALGIILGYVTFAATAVLLFRLSGHDPHAVQPAAFIV